MDLQIQRLTALLLLLIGTAPLLESKQLTDSTANRPLTARTTSTVTCDAGYIQCGDKRYLMEKVDLATYTAEESFQDCIDRGLLPAMPTTVEELACLEAAHTEKYFDAFMGYVTKTDGTFVRADGATESPSILLNPKGTKPIVGNIFYVTGQVGVWKSRDRTLNFPTRFCEQNNPNVDNFAAVMPTLF